MSQLFTPRSLLQVGSLLNRGDDPHVQPGWHIVMRTHERLGLPLHPFVAVPLLDWSETPSNLFTAAGQPVRAPFDLRTTSLVRIADGTTPLDSRLLCGRIEVAPDSRIEVNVTEPGHAGRVIARRMLPDRGGRTSWRFPVPGRAQLVLRGEGVVTALVTFRFPAGVAAAFDPGNRAVTFGLPVPGDFRWYAGGEGDGPALDRVKRGAPVALSPIDQPDGALVPADAGLDVDLVRARADAIMTAVKIAVEDPAPDPRDRLWAFQGSTLSADDDSRVTLSAPAALQTFAGDPSLARFLGFSQPVQGGFDDRTIWLVAALFGVEMRDAFGLGRIGDHLMPQGPDEIGLRDALLQRYPSLNRIRKAQEDASRVVVPILGVAVPTELDRPIRLR